MKFATAILIATGVLTGTAMAQDRDNNNMRDKRVAPVHHRVSHHRPTYKRTYKTDEEEHQATEELNRQYRGVPRSDVH